MSSNPWQQGLYWNNFPVEPRKNLGFLEENIKDTNLATKTYPYIIFTGIHEINFIQLLQNDELIESLRKSGLHIFLYEPVSYYLKEPGVFNHGYYSEFHTKHDGHAMCGEMDSIQDFTLKTGINCIVHSCDYRFKEVYGKKYPLVNVVTEDIFIKTHTRPPTDVYFVKHIQKPFLSINGRYTPHRHLMMAYLADKPGNYVWRFNQDFDEIMKHSDWQEDNLPYDKLRDGNALLNTRTFEIDYTVTKKEVTDLCGGTEVVHSFNSELVDSMNECFCLVVNETRFAQPTGNISEKVFQGFNSLTPIILAAPPRSLEYVRELGFKTFEKYWDESYDLEPNHSKRLEKIYAVIDYINDKSLSELNDMYNDMMPILEYNFQKMETFNVREKVIYK